MPSFVYIVDGKSLNGVLNDARGLLTYRLPPSQTVSPEIVCPIPYIRAYCSIFDRFFSQQGVGFGSRIHRLFSVLTVRCPASPCSR